MVTSASDIDNNFFFSDAVKCALSGPDLESKPGGKCMERWQFRHTLSRVQIWPIFTYSIGCHIPHL